MPTDTAKPKRPAGKRTREVLSPEEQRQRFEDAVRELGCDTSEERFNDALDVIGRYKPKDDKTAKPSS